MIASCGRCPAQWTGHRAEHCTVCHVTFSGTTAGDMHQVGDHAIFTGPNRRRCLSRVEMQAKGMESRVNAQGTEIWGTGRGQKQPFWLAQDESDGLPATPEGGCPAPTLKGA